MTTGNEPMLHQPPNDNSPMIGRRGAQIIVNARGAYLAGNLDGLIQVMSDEQQRRFRMAIVELALHFARILVAEYEGNCESLTSCIADAEDWLRDGDGQLSYTALDRLLDSGAIRPIPEEMGAILDSRGHFLGFRNDATYDVRGATHGYFPTDDISKVAMRIALTMQMDELHQMLANFAPWWAIHHILTARGFAFTESVDLSLNCTKPWQLAAAWAILQGHEPPPFPELPT